MGPNRGKAANGPRPHAVTAITPQVGGGTVNTSFTYDANGNMLTGHDRTYAWTAFDMPSTITRGAQTLAFTYGIGHQRIRQVKNGGAETIQYYGGGQAERITDATGTRWIDYVSVGGRLIGTQTRAEGAALGAGVAAYYHVDHLGSVDRITDWQGTVVEVQDYDAWGKRRFATGAPDSGGTITSTARRGFTGHEQLDSVGLVHMNGRVYDPFVARFTSADPMLQAPQNLQSHNRYSYALNNPLSYTDPSGFFNIGKFFKKVFKAVGSFVKGFAKFLFSRQGLSLVVGLTLAVFLGPGAFGIAGLGWTGAGFWGGFAAAAIGGAASGAISTGTLKGAIIGAVSAAVTYTGSMNC